MDKQLIRARLVQLNDHISRVQSTMSQEVSAFYTNRNDQDIVCFNLQNAIQTCIDIATHICASHSLHPMSASGAFVSIAEEGLLSADLSGRMVKAVAFRNVLVHKYIDLDWSVVAFAATSGLADLKEFGKWALDFADDSEPPPPCG
jgi:uncharacterized protein YutE (UPF0331/DUF86 family)